MTSKPREKVLIFDLDKTIASPSCLKYEGLRKKVIKLLNYANLNKIPIYIVTTRPIKDSYFKETSKIFSRNKKIKEEDKLIRIQFDVFRSNLHEDIINLVIGNVCIMNDIEPDTLFKKQKNKTMINKEFVTKIFNLNMNPSTRWFYYLNMVKTPKYKEGVVDEICRYDFISKYLEENNSDIKFPPRAFSEDSWGGITTGIVKMLQILDIVQLHNYSWDQIIFFDDAKHNYEAWREYLLLLLGDSNKMTFLHGNIDHECVFMNHDVFVTLQKILNIDLLIDYYLMSEML